MKPERWRQIEQLYDRALEHAAGERMAFLAQACGGNEALRREVETLIACHEEAGSFSGFTRLASRSQRACRGAG